MSRIDELIAELCPDGVVFRPIWQLTTWDKKFNAVERFKQPEVRKYRYLLANEMTPFVVEGGDVKLLTTNDSNLWTTEAIAGGPIHEGEIIAIPWGGNAIVQYFNGRFVTSDNRIAVANDPNELSMKFLYYFIQGNLGTLVSFYRGSGIKHPSMAKVLDWRIPVPPLEVQREIVRVLDQFTQLEAELEAELGARRRQYEYYRGSLLAFGDEVERALLGDIATIGTGSHDTKDAVVDGEYVFYARGREPLRLDSFDFDESAIITAGDGVGVGKVFHFATGQYALHQRAYRIVPDEGVDARYIYHYLVADFARYLERNSVHASVTSLRRPMFLKYPVPLPPLDEQRRISSDLDKFDALVNDLSIGLPAELAARRKQYEHYRDELLTFEEAAA